MLEIITFQACFQNARVIQIVRDEGTGQSYVLSSFYEPRRKSKKHVIM